MNELECPRPPELLFENQTRFRDTVLNTDTLVGDRSRDLCANCLGVRCEDVYICECPADINSKLIALAGLDVSHGEAIGISREDVETPRSVIAGREGFLSFIVRRPQLSLAPTRLDRWVLRST